MYWVICAFDCLRAASYEFKKMRGEIGWNGFVAIVRFTSFTFALLQSLLPLFAGLFLLAVSPNEYGVSLYLIYYIYHCEIPNIQDSIFLQVKFRRRVCPGVP